MAEPFVIPQNIRVPGRTVGTIVPLPLAIGDPSPCGVAYDTFVSANASEYATRFLALQAFRRTTTPDCLAWADAQISAQPAQTTLTDPQCENVWQTYRSSTGRGLSMDAALRDFATRFPACRGWVNIQLAALHPQAITSAGGTSMGKVLLVVGIGGGLLWLATRKKR